MSSCRICKSNNLISILNLGEQYLSEFRDDDKKPPKFPLELVICNDCKQVQLRDTVPQNLLYTDNYGYRSGINNTMRDHLHKLANDALIKVHFMAGDDIRVADIGANEGTLLKYYPSYLERWGFDLVPKFARDYDGTGINFTTTPFSSKFGKFKIITAISMFYDLDDPVAFMQTMADNLERKGIIVISQNYLLSMLQINGFENAVHEHIFYHTMNSMNRICEKCGLEIFDVQVNDLNGGSFRTYICHRGDYKVSKKVRKQMEYELDYGVESVEALGVFRDNVENARNELLRFVQLQVASGKKVGVLGCSTRGNTLLQYCRLDNQLIYKGYERNHEKFGKKIASVGIPIVSEDEILNDKPDYLLVLPFFFRREMVSRYAKYIKQGGKLIFPLPKLEIVGK